MHEVVITGIGATAGTATNAEHIFETLQKGDSMIRDHPLYKSYGFKNSALAFIDPAIWKKIDQFTDTLSLGYLSNNAKLALYTSNQAWASGGLGIGEVNPERSGVFIGCNKYVYNEHHLIKLIKHIHPADFYVDLDRFIEQENYDPSGYFQKHQDAPVQAVANYFNLQAIQSAHGDACTAGSIAISQAFRRIRAGDLDIALAGACELMANFIPVAYFTALGALVEETSFPAHQISRPFDKQRQGFVMGEGSAFLVLESEEHALKRGGTILARIKGCAIQLESYRITASSADGSDYARCMHAALADAQKHADDIDHINAHGTSTQANDSSEAMAIKQVFHTSAYTVPVTSNKSALGHSLAGSGAIEAVLSVLSLQKQQLLPTLNFSEADESTVGLDIVTQTRLAPLRCLISNSFGFGGENCSIVLEKA